MKATQLRKGQIIKHEGRYFRVFATTHVTPGKGRGMVQSKLRDLENGTMNDHKFRSDDEIERAHLETHEMEFLYQEGDQYHFMNTESFEQIHMNAEELGDAVNYLVANVKLPVEFIEGKAVGINLPVTVDLKVVETEPELKGATAASTRKPATTETGLVVQVPAFIKKGERIRVATEDGSYMARAN